MKAIDKDSGVPIYIQIKDEIVKFVKTFDSTQSIPHHEELARIFGTSRVTVAKAVSELKKENILTAVKGRGTFFTGTIPVNEKHLVIEKRKLITFIIPSNDSSPIFQGCQREADKDGFQLLLKNYQERGDDDTFESFLKCERDFLLRYRAGEFGESLILYYEGGEDNLDILKSLIDMKKPFVCIDKMPENLPVDYVGFDNFNAARMVTEEFIKMGRKNIALVGAGSSSAGQEKLNGYRKAFKDNGLALKEENIIFEPDFHYYCDQEKVLKRLLDRFRQRIGKVDAVYCMTAFFERVVLGQLSNSDLPGNILLAGEEQVDIPWFRNQYAIKIKWPYSHMGEEAVRLLKAKILSPDRNKIEQIKLPVEIIRK